MISIFSINRESTHYTFHHQHIFYNQIHPSLFLKHWNKVFFFSEKWRSHMWNSCGWCLFFFVQKQRFQWQWHAMLFNSVHVQVPSLPPPLPHLCAAQNSKNKGLAFVVTWKTLISKSLSTLLMPKRLLMLVPHHSPLAETFKLNAAIRLSRVWIYSVSGFYFDFWLRSSIFSFVSSVHWFLQPIVPHSSISIGVSFYKVGFKLQFLHFVV